MQVLIADDDPISRHLLQSCLRQWNYEVITCLDGEDALRVLQSEAAPRLAILDWMMPALDGLQICRFVRQHNSTPYMYLILLTSKDEKKDLIEGLEAGADDYLIKPVNVKELEVRLRSARRILELQEELLATRETLRIQATHDPLTGLPNRRAILEYLGREVARLDREQAPLSVVLMDLDHFKRVNDTYGHLIGDAVLVEATRRMQSCLRSYDVIGRYGGEEFLIVLPGSDWVTALKQAERIRACIQTEVICCNGLEIPLTCSVGATTFTSSTEELNGESMIRCADDALYLAKHSGRNRVEFIGLQNQPSLKL